MTDLERLDELIDIDHEYQQLVTDVNAFSGSKFPTTAVSLENIGKHVPKFAKMGVEEFFATFKCMTAGAVMMSKILTKIHGDSKYDSKKSFVIYNTSGNKMGLIYYENNPSFYIETSNPDGPLYITMPLKVSSTKKDVDGEIMFRLIGPSVLYNPRTMKHTPKLLSSVMEIIIKHDGDVYDQPVQVRNFEPTWLAIAINNSRMGN